MARASAEVSTTVTRCPSWASGTAKTPAPPPTSSTCSGPLWISGSSAAQTAALRPGGRLSVTAANRAGAVLARALGGHPVEARALLGDRDPAPSRSRTRPARRRYSPDELLALVRDAGLQAGEWRGVSVVADLLESTSGADPAALRALELQLASTSPYRDVATGLHLLASRGAGPA